MPDRKPIALAGIGKIARDAHIPALDASPDWELACTISRNAGVDGVRGVTDIDAFLADPQGIDCVSLALPPGPRFDYAVRAINAGMNVMLEKPPGRTLAEARHLQHLAEARGVTLYASWHSRMGAAVTHVAKLLKGADIAELRIDWREDVREWHPGQDWVFEAGNLGVFDPGINAMSILVAILDQQPHLTAAHLIVPENGQTPIAADLTFSHPGGGAISGRLDWRHQGQAVWDMWIKADGADIALCKSGSELTIDGTAVDVGPTAEYPACYALFADLVRRAASEVDLRPLEQVADAFLVGSREQTEGFYW